MNGCWWRGHKWGRWEPANIRLSEDGRFVAWVTGQLRECERCGKEKLRHS